MRFLDFLFPRSCALCRADLPSSRPWPLCRDCLSGLRPAPRARPGEPRAAFEFGAAARALVTGLKDDGRSELAGVMGDWMAACVDPREALPDLWVPVPPDPRRARLRGLDHAGLLAARVAVRTRRPMLPVLDRRAGRAQRGLERRDRVRNLEGAFACVRGAPLRGLRVGIVDDVATTGATLAEARRALTGAGARPTLGVVFARVRAGL